MFKKQALKNNQLFIILSLYTLSHIFLCSNNFYLNFINPLFWLSFLIIFYHHINLSMKKETNTALTISLIFLMLYLASGLIFGFNKSQNNLINIFINIWQVILPIIGIEIIRYKLIKSNKNLGIRALITIIIIISEINFKALFLSHNLVLFHYLISTIIPIIAKNLLFTYLTLNTNQDITIIIRLFNEIPKLFLQSLLYNNWFIEGSFTIIKILIIYFIFKYFVFKT